MIKVTQKLALATAGVALSFTALNLTQQKTLAAQFGGNVLPANTIRNGYSLTDVADAIALFQDRLAAEGVVDTSLLPDTPFEILTVAADTYQVSTNTYFYVPLFIINDSPPALGTFPADSSQSAFYFFSPSQLGAEELSITVDGERTNLGAEYIAGPIVKALPNGGNNTLVVGTFLEPFQPGEHTVEINVRLNGDLISELFGRPCSPQDCFVSNINYTINSQAVPESNTVLGIVLIAGVSWAIKRQRKASI